jgi:bacillithiol synthase
METISYQKSGYFSKLICDYLDENSSLQGLYNRFPTLGNFRNQIQEKQKNFSLNTRAILVDCIQNQYKNFNTSKATSEAINLLKLNNTFTITTGHQLNIYTGPLYFLYKIVSTINLCKQLKETHPDFHFVPIYWMASEDHDFEEINHFQLHEKIFRWNTQSHSPVGRFSTKGIDPVFEAFSKEIGISDNALQLISLFKKSYLEHNTLADATRYLVNELFGDLGLIILNGDDRELKKEFIPYVKKELLTQSSYANVLTTNEKLSNYSIQVNPREINLFYIEDTSRERIIFKDGYYKINNTSLVFSQKEIIVELEKNPEKFSPNVVLRPLYQEVILPNLCYIGGGGELAYWLQLKSNFDSFNVTFPILLLRNSVLLVTEKQLNKKAKLNLNWEDLFSKQEDLIHKKTKEFSSVKFDFTQQKLFLKQQFESLAKIALQTDKSFIGALNAQEAKQIKGLNHLEKRLLKAEKKNQSYRLERIKELQNQLFPNYGLQERNLNFSEFFEIYGNQLISKLIEEIKPLQFNFTIIKL